MNYIFSDIKEFKNFKTIIKITRGYSDDQKYHIITNDGTNLLLRISDINLYDKKLKEFEFIKQLNKLDFEMSKAIEIGKCNNNKNVYIILSWVEGESLDKIVTTLNEDQQYKLGIEAGKILYSIHNMDYNLNIQSGFKDNLIKNKIQKLNMYIDDNNIRVKNDIEAINYINNNIFNILNLPPTYIHGDFHLGNLIYTKNNKIGVIDFNRFKISDRFEDFYKNDLFNVPKSVPFSCGFIDGYFNNSIPDYFWKINSVYVAFSSMNTIRWSKKFGEKEIEKMRKKCVDIFKEYNYFKEYIPKWYINFKKSRK